MTEPTPAQLAEAAFLQGEGEEITSLLMGAIAASAERAGVPIEQHLGYGVGVIMAAAWSFAKIIDDDSDGGRAARYADQMRRHADAVERLG